MNCRDCKWGNCGIDSHTITRYKQEKNVGNRLKVILLQVYDMVELDNLQINEIKALLNNLVDNHIHEEER